MNLRQKKLVLNFSAVFVVVMAVCALVVALAMEVKVVQKVIKGSRSVPISVDVKDGDITRASSGDEQKINLSQLQILCRRDLRAALDGSGAPEKKPMINNAAALGITLVGIAVEDGNSMAVLKKRDGTLAVCREGESFENLNMRMAVSKIEDSTVVLDFNSSQYRFELPEKNGGIR